MKTHINTLEESKAFVSEFRSQPGYRQPWAFATGIATVSRAGNILDTYYPFLNHLSNPGSSTVLSVVNNHLAGTATFEMDPSMRDKIFAYFTPFIDDGKPHPNIEAIDTAFRVVNAYNNRHGSGKRVVVTFIDHPEHDHGPTDVPNAYLRLALLSSGLMRRKEDVVLEGISEFLPINMWTSEGPVAPEDLQYRQLLAMERGENLSVFGTGQYPHVLDYVTPKGDTVLGHDHHDLGEYVSPDESAE